MPTFWAGIEQITLLSGGRATSFLLGRFSENGWAGYFPAAFLMKTPLVLIARAYRHDLVAKDESNLVTRFLLVPIIGFYVLAAQSALNIGYRHVLPALPYLLLMVSGLAAAELRASGRGLFYRRCCWPGQMVLVGVAIWTYPNYLSYFNPAVGGPSNGYRLLTDSNVDWGQDLAIRN